MQFAGFQPLSLLDYPGVISSILFTQGCPFRCVYCHNPELIPLQNSDIKNLIDEEIVLQHLQKRKHLVEGVCITGGEPTIHPRLPAFIKKVKALGLLVKLDTNGISPHMIKELINERLVDFIAMDLKHTWERYSDVIGINQKKAIENCRATFELIQKSSIPHEFRTTVYSGLHSKEDILTIAQQLQAGENYALQAIRYDSLYDPELPKTQQLNLEEIANEICHLQPRLHIEVRR